MTQYPGMTATLKRRLANRWRAWVLSLDKSEAVLSDLPGPRSLGSMKIGVDMVQGNVKFAGRLVMAPGASVWEIRAPDDAFRVDMHGFVWLDHLAAVASKSSVAKMQLWVDQWISSFGKGHGLAWSAELVGQRQIRFLHHYDDLTRDASDDARRRLDQILLRQARFLEKRWQKSPQGFPRLEAIAALVLSARAIEGFGLSIDSLRKSLRRQCERLIDEAGGVVTRNPEDLLHLLSLLIWMRDDLGAQGETVPEVLSEKIEDITPIIRSLRHYDGALARFQGGASGMTLGLDQALASSGIRGIAGDGGMGFVRMTSGRSSVIVDAAKPAKGEASFDAHASTLALELTSGRRPIFVSCGSGAAFGPDWRKAGRATPSHSVLGLDGSSSSRLGRGRDILGQKREQMESRPSKVELHHERHLEYLRLEGSHDGYLRTHGLMQGRALELTIDGSALAGEEVLLSEDRRARARFDKLVDSARKGVPFTVRFHLHPDVMAEYDLELNAYRLTLKNGEIWLFRHDGNCEMALESSVYLDQEAIKPTATKQVVLTGRAMDYATRIRWSLAKTPESLRGIRDLAELDAELTN